MVHLFCDGARQPINRPRLCKAVSASNLPLSFLPSTLSNRQPLIAPTPLLLLFLFSPPSRDAVGNSIFRDGMKAANILRTSFAAHHGGVQILPARLLQVRQYVHASLEAVLASCSLARDANHSRLLDSCRYEHPNAGGNRNQSSNRFGALGGANTGGNDNALCEKMHGSDGPRRS